MVNVLSICFSALFLFDLALAGASNGRVRRHRNAPVEPGQKRAAEDHHDLVRAAPSGSTLAGAARKRAQRRCNGRSSTTTLTSTSTTPSTVTTPLIDNPGGDPTHTPPTTTTTSTTSTTTTHRTKKASSPKKPVPTSTTSSSGGGGGGGGGGGTYSGDGTYYAPGLGACGWTNSDTDYIAAVSYLLFDSWPGAGANPNDNPVCGRYATAHYGGNSVRVKIVDRCTGCKKWDLDFSPTAFDQIADPSLGRIHITWSWS